MSTDIFPTASILPRSLAAPVVSTRPRTVAVPVGNHANSQSSVGRASICGPVQSSRRQKESEVTSILPCSLAAPVVSTRPRTVAVPVGNPANSQSSSVCRASICGPVQSSRWQKESEVTSILPCSLAAPVVSTRPCTVAVPVGNPANSQSSSVSRSSICVPVQSSRREKEVDCMHHYIPIYVMLPLGTVTMECNIADNFESTLKTLAQHTNIDGVMIDIWWGVVEKHNPGEYRWMGYRQIFNVVRELGLKLQVVMSFHQCGGNVGDDVWIPLPDWVLEMGMENPDIFFTDRMGQRNKECLSWGVDRVPIFGGRTALEVYRDYMSNFHQYFKDFFEDGTITEVEVGLGPCGELRYPSYAADLGWKYPGPGEFQCYDTYLLENLSMAAAARGCPEWGKPPVFEGRPYSDDLENFFFKDGGQFDEFYGRFFLDWYSRVLIDHADSVLSLAKVVFNETPIAAKISGVHWTYKTMSHAAELTAGFYNPANRDGYSPIALILKKYNAAMNFTCVEMRTRDAEVAFSDPEGLVWQVLNAAWDVGIPFASENALPCYGEDAYNKILEIARPNDPLGRHMSAFTYLRLCPELMKKENLTSFASFVSRMHGV